MKLYGCTFRPSKFGRLPGREPGVLFAFLILMAAFVTGVNAQVDDKVVAAPPPVRIISKEDKSRLDAVTDLKLRTKLTLEMMDARLIAAQTHNAARDYNGIY